MWTKKIIIIVCITFLKIVWKLKTRKKFFLTGQKNHQSK